MDFADYLPMYYDVMNSSGMTTEQYGSQFSDLDFRVAVEAAIRQAANYVQGKIRERIGFASWPFSVDQIAKAYPGIDPATELGDDCFQIKTVVQFEAISRLWETAGQLSGEANDESDRYRISADRELESYLAKAAFVAAANAPVVEEAQEDPLPVSGSTPMVLTW